MNKLKLLIADNNVDYCKRLEANFRQCYMFDVLSSVHDGYSALMCVSSEKPDILIMDIVMPKMDGIELLFKLKSLNLAPGMTVFVNSSLHDDNIIDLTQNMGVVYFFAKPTTFCYMLNRVVDLINLSEAQRAELKTITLEHERDRQVTREELITNYMRLVGIPAHISGYRYLRTAIDYMVQEHGKRLGITTEIYPYVAKQFNSTVQRVERSIRHAIGVAWINGNMEIQHKLFGHTVNEQKGHPTNGEFMSMIADRVYMRLKHKN